MKKKLTYRDKLIELAKIYNVKEVYDYIKGKKNLTSGQLELILRKNKIIIPKDLQYSFLKENVTKPLFKLKLNITSYKAEKIKEKNKFFRKVENYKHDTKRRFNYGLNNLWKSIGKAGSSYSGDTKRRFNYALSNLWKSIGNAGLNFLNIMQNWVLQFTLSLVNFLRIYLMAFIIIK